MSRCGAGPAPARAARAARAARVATAATAATPAAARALLAARLLQIPVLLFANSHARGPKCKFIVNINYISLALAMTLSVCI